MAIRMARPVKRKDTSYIYFRQRVPRDVVEKARGIKFALPIGPETITAALRPGSETLAVSLRTRDPGDAKARQAVVTAYLDAIWRGLRGPDEMALTHRQATALGGELYRSWANECRETTLSVHISLKGKIIPDDPMHVELLRLARWGFEEEKWRELRLAGDASALEPHLRPLLERLLLSHGIPRVDRMSCGMILLAFCQALEDAFANRQRNAEGDYTPDPKASRFPEWQPPQPPAPPAPSVSLTGLVEEWWKEGKKAGRSEATYDNYRFLISRLVEFLKHDDAARVTPADIVAFKDHRLATGVSASTLTNNNLPNLKAIFAWAVANHRLPANPAATVRMVKAKEVQTRGKGFTPEEAGAILRHAEAHVAGPQETPKTAAARRWVPWLCAYTGARVGELVQLRKEDVRQVGEEWVITITPEAGTVKDKEVREVLLHRHLVDIGFPEFVTAAKPGHLFLTPNKDGETRAVWVGVKQRISTFVRKVVQDDRVSPSHGWRHTFTTVCREAEIPDSVIEAITGHAPASTGRRYGAVTIATQAKALARFPRFDLTAPED